ncbi:BTAD domain-containing putative transcriptional regulator [Streptomyces sp. NPDC002920]
MTRMPLRFAVLGDVRVWRGEAEVDPGPPLRRTLLALLLARAGSPVPLADIVEALWADRAPARAVNMVHRHVGELRRLLEPGLPNRAEGNLLLRGVGGYRLRTPADSVDLLLFRQRVRTARDLRRDGELASAVEEFAGALALWRGPTAGCPAQAPAHPVFTELDREYDAVVREAAEVALGCGRAGRVLPTLTASAARHPLDEGLQSLLIHTLTACGHRAEALTVFRTTATRLTEDLGVDPGCELIAAQEQAKRTGPEAEGLRPEAEGLEAAGPETGPGADGSWAQPRSAHAEAAGPRAEDARAQPDEAGAAAGGTGPGAGGTRAQPGEAGAGKTASGVDGARAQPGEAGAGAGGTGARAQTDETGAGAGGTAPGAGSTGIQLGEAGAGAGGTRAQPGEAGAGVGVAGVGFRGGGGGVAGPAQLPPALPVFVGRAVELGRLRVLLDDAGAAPALVVSTLTGPAGVGKTALAVHLSHEVAGRFPDGQLYVNLRGFDPAAPPTRPQDAVRGFLDALGVPAARAPYGLDAQAALFRSLLTGRRVLVLLDNARDAAQVRPLLPGTPGCLVLVTSRNRLTALASADGARPLTLDVLTPAEAHAALALRIGAARAAAEPRAIADIVALTARLPLALAMVAARAATHPAFPLAALAERLRAAHGGLDAFRDPDPDPATDMRAVFSWSYDALGVAAARLFRLLSLHPGPEVAVHTAAALAGEPLARTRALVAELTDAHLLTERSPGRYTCHDLLRAYATELVHATESPGERRAALRRVLDHHSSVGHKAGTLRPLPPAYAPATHNEECVQ